MVEKKMLAFLAYNQLKITTVQSNFNFNIT